MRTTIAILITVFCSGCASIPVGLGAKTTNSVTLSDSPTNGLLVEVKNSMAPGAVEGAVQSVELEQTTAAGEKYILRVGVDRKSDTLAQAAAIQATHAATMQVLGESISKALDLVPNIVNRPKPQPAPVVNIPVVVEVP